MPWPRGRLREVDSLVLLDAADRPQPLQARALEHWSDGSARWVLLDSLVGIENAAAGGGFFLETGEPGRELPPPAQLSIVRSAEGRRLAVDTGAARFHLDRDHPGLFDRVEVGGRPALAAGSSRIQARDAEGLAYGAAWQRFSVEDAGPVRVTVRLDGQLTAPRAGPLVDLVMRLAFAAGSGAVRVEATLVNRRRAGHRRGLWGLGSRGSVFLRDVTIGFALPPGEESPTLRLSPERGSPRETLAGPVELYQDSSGGENWRSPNHVNRSGEIPVQFRGYRLRAAESEVSGLRATPIATLERGGAFLALGMREFWQNFPKALTATQDEISLALFPAQWADTHELQGGEQKTHGFHVAFTPDEVSAEPLEWCRSPLCLHPEPGWYAEAEAAPYLTPASEDPNRGYLDLVSSAIEGADTFESKRERIDEYGWRSFGDLYADHETVFHRGPEPLVSHYNNQYDAVLGFGVQFMRSGDLRWLRLMDELGRHFLDIDRYHTAADKSAINGGVFWHTDHYVDAGLSNHRSYPPAPGVRGGGPSCGNLYAGGLMLLYLLTGNEMARQAVLELGDFVIDSDDGRKTVFRFLDRGYTGLVSESGDSSYHGPGRTPANAISALIDASRLSAPSGDRRYLDKAEQLIRRCVHPSDDLRERKLSEPVKRWYYTVFLQSLGKYLDFKAEKGELDYMVAYARESLLHYARWALEHEIPYLDKPERLDVPDSTWAAQDMRKAEILKLAARHATGEERHRFLERARFFFDNTLETLAGMETRSLCRPMVLLLTNGYSQAYFDRLPESSPAGAVESFDFGAPETFVSQKQRVKKRLAWLAVLAAAALVAGLAAALQFSGSG